MSKWKFIIIGLFVATLGEGVNNFVVGIEGKDAIPNFLFAMGFYTVILLVASWYATRYLKTLTRGNVVCYMLLFGIGVGLLINEWLLVQNHPLNPNVAHPISQLSMVAFHTALYTTPLLYLRVPAVRPLLRKVGFSVYLLALLAAGVALQLSGEYRLALALFTTYFIAYLAYFATLVYVIFSWPLYNPNLHDRQFKLNED